MVDECGSESHAAPGGIHHPLDAADEPQRTAEPMQRGVGDDLPSVDREQREDLGVIDIATPRVDQPAIVDVVPREALVVVRQTMKEVIESIDVIAGEGADENTPAVAKNGFLRITMR